ncbi:MAG: hypothetical protein J6N78_01800 [Clostridia bacterium]|nr:hypothetical protein [Clostridia bacterium]
MARGFITSENALEYLKQIRDTMISEGCNIREASEKVGVKKTAIDNCMKHYYKSDEYRKVEEEISTLNEDLTCSKYVKLRLEGNSGNGYVFKAEKLEEIYETIILPSLTLTGEALDKYKNQRPLLDFEAVAEYHEKKKSGEIYRSSIIDGLNSILSGDGGRKLTLEYIKSLMSQYELLKNDEEIIELLGKVDKAREKEKIIKSINKYINSNKKVGDVSDNLNSLVLEIASLSDEKIKEEYPDINIVRLRNTASRIQRKQERSYIVIDNTKIEEGKERTRTLKKISNGNFIVNDITTQEQFDSFLADIPVTYTRIRKRAQDMWDKYNEYKEYDINKLEEKRAELEKEYRYAKTYKSLIEQEIKVDYVKLVNKPIEQLIEIEKIVSENMSDYFNKKNNAENLIGDIIIDDESKDDYSRIPQESRIIRTNTFLYKLKGELDLVKSIIDLKRKEKEERLNEEQIGEEQIIDDTEELQDVEDITQNIENSVESEKNEDDFESLSNEELLALQESLDAEIDDTESQISALQTSIEEVNNQIKSEKEKQEAEKRKQLIESITRKRKRVQDGNAKIGSLMEEFATKQQELNSLLKDRNSNEGEKTKDE